MGSRDPDMPRTPWRTETEPLPYWTAPGPPTFAPDFTDGALGWRRKRHDRSAGARRLIAERRGYHGGHYRTASIDTTYGATLGEDGMLMAVFFPTLVIVMVGMHVGECTAECINPMSVLHLGQSGMTVTLIHDEAMVWWIGSETPIARGDTHTVGANDYTFTPAEGARTATFARRMVEGSISA